MYFKGRTAERWIISTDFRVIEIIDDLNENSYKAELRGKARWNGLKMTVGEGIEKVNKNNNFSSFNEIACEERIGYIFVFLFL